MSLRQWYYLIISSSAVPSLYAFNLSQHKGHFYWVTSSQKWPKYWSFNFRISPSNEYSGLMSFRIDCFDLLAVQGTLKSGLQHRHSKASVLQHSAFTMVQLSHPYTTTWKTTALTILTFVRKVMSLFFFNTLSRFVIAFPPRNKHLFILWLQSSSTVILKPKKIKSVTAFPFPSSICHEVIGPGAMILAFWMLSFKPAFSFSYFTFINFNIVVHLRLHGTKISINLNF